MLPLPAQACFGINKVFLGGRIVSGFMPGGILPLVVRIANAAREDNIDLANGPCDLPATLAYWAAYFQLTYVCSSGNLSSAELISLPVV